MGKRRMHCHLCAVVCRAPRGRKDAGVWRNLTALWFYWPERFYARYDRELTNQERRAAAAGVESYNRPNVASDLNHDRIVAAHPRTTFYDYTAGFVRMIEYLAGRLPANYHLTLSVKESTPFDNVEYVISRGGNVAVVVDTYYWGPTKRYGLMPAHAPRFKPRTDRGSLRFRSWTETVTTFVRRNSTVAGG